MTYMVMMVIGTSFRAGIYIVGALVTLALVVFMVIGPATWRNSRATRWFESRNAARTMGMETSIADQTFLAGGTLSIGM